MSLERERSVDGMKAVV